MRSGRALPWKNSTSLVASPRAANRLGDGRKAVLGGEAIERQIEIGQEPGEPVLLDLREQRQRRAVGDGGAEDLQRRVAAGQKALRRLLDAVLVEDRLRRDVGLI